MALSKPTLYSVPAWDVELGYSFRFNVVGGDQIVGSTLKIYNNLTSDLVYTNVYTSYDSVNVVPPDAIGLENGGYYYANLTTRNANDEESVVSNTIQFYCFSTPSWDFTVESGIPSGIISNSTLDASVTYDQAEQENLNSYIVNLYSADDRLLATSGTQYTDTAELPTIVKWVFSGLSDYTQYKIEATGITVHGTEITTGRQSFTVNYISPEGFSNFILTNNCQEGYIAINSNYVNIVGESNPDPAEYIDDEEIDLTEDGSWARWRDGFIVPSNFTANVWFREPNENIDLVIMRNSNGQSIVLSCVEDEEDSNKIYMVLTVDDAYEIYTGSLPKNQSYVTNIRSINNVYDLIFTVV